MQIANQYRLAQYEDFGQLGSKSHIHLMRDKRNGKMCVRKEIEPIPKDIIEFRKKHNSKYYPQLFEVFEDNEKWVLIEEYIEGVTLREYMMGEKLLEKQAVDFAVQICQALLPMHLTTPAIVYRDLKPVNIMVTTKGCIKLVDFNISRVYHEGQTRDTMLLGTAEYAAPEQYGYFQTDNRTDIYAFGVLFNFMLTGKVPVEEITQGKYESIIRKCTELEPSRRYQNIQEILDDLSLYITIEKEPKIIEGTKEKFVRILKEWAIPGFRTMNVGKMIIAVLVYWFILRSCILLEMTNEDGTLVPVNEIWVYRICFGIAFFCCVFYSFNYRGIAEKICFIPQRTKLAHVIESIIICIGIGIASLFVIALILAIFGV